MLKYITPGTEYAFLKKRQKLKIWMQMLLKIKRIVKIISDHS